MGKVNLIIVFSIFLLFGAAIAPIPDYFGINILFISIMDRIGVICIGGIVLFYFFQGKVRIPFLVGILIFYLCIITIHNWESQYVLIDHKEMDVYVYLRFVLFIILGYNVLIWKEISVAFISLLRLGIVLNVISIIIQSTFLRELIEESSLTYKIQYLLLPSVFFIFFLQKLKASDRNIILISFTLYIIEQILFQKRLPLARVALIILCLIITTNYVNVYKGASKLLVNSWFKFGFYGMFFLFIFSLTGKNISTYFDATINRFYEVGGLFESKEKDARFEIGELVIADVEESGHQLFGRGLGGVVFSDKFHLMTSSGIRFRAASEMGIPTIILKGGYCLLIIMVLIILRSLLSIKYVRSSQFTIACWVLVFIWSLFLYAEGFIGAMGNINEILLGYSIGLLLRLPIRNNVLPF